MPRVFAQTFTVPPDAIDELRHVNNLKYLAWMQDVAIAHSAAQGWPLERYLEAGAGWVVRSHAIEYRRPALLGDGITLLTWVSGFGQRSSPRKYLFRRDRDGQTLATAETTWVHVDFRSGQPRDIPDALRAAFEVVSPEEEAEPAGR